MVVPPPRLDRDPGPQGTRTLRPGHQPTRTRLRDRLWLDRHAGALGNEEPCAALKSTRKAVGLLRDREAPRLPLGTMSPNAPLRPNLAISTLPSKGYRPL